MITKIICPYCRATKERPEGVEMELYSGASIYYVCPVCKSRSPEGKKPKTQDIQEKYKAEGFAKLAALRRFKPFLKPLTWDEAIEDDYYLEIKGDEYIDVALLQAAFATEGKIQPCDHVLYTTHDMDGLKLLGVDYGKTWRCWPRRPTEEECNAVKWDDGSVSNIKPAEREVKAEQPKPTPIPAPVVEAVQENDSEKFKNYKNEIAVSGWLAGKLTVTHEIEGKPFYEGKLLVERRSGIVDELLLLIPGSVHDAANLDYEHMVRIQGEIRTYDVPNRPMLRVKVFAHKMWMQIEPSEADNAADVVGTLCKPPVLRKTPFDRTVCDLMVAVQRGAGKTAYFPCVAWGKVAERVAGYKVGDRVHIEGRLQSRVYQKVNERFEQENFTVHELSAFAIYKENFSGGV